MILSIYLHLLAPIAPESRHFIQANSSFVTLKLQAWGDGGCPLSHFTVQYKQKALHEWLLLSNHVLPEQEHLQVRDLQAASWYDLLVLAKNEAGTTEANFVFSTLTNDGFTVAPLLSENGHSSSEKRQPLEGVLVLVPSLCALLVLFLVGGTVLYILFFKTRTLNANIHNIGMSRDPGSETCEDLQLHLEFSFTNCVLLLYL